MRNSFIDTVIETAKGRRDITFLSGDAGLGVFDAIKENDPDLFLNLGVAEQNMAGFAAGLAMTGRAVYMYNIIPFLLYRCYEQVRNDICYQNLPVTLVGIGSGVTYAPAGMSHYAIEDLGLAATLPNLTVISPCDSNEARAAANFSLITSAPLYVRLAKRGEQQLHSQTIADITIPQVIQEGTDCAILFHGSIGDDALKAVHLLNAKGISVALVSIPMLQPLDASHLLKLIEGIRLVVTMEEHYAHTGLGGLIARIAGEKQRSWTLMTKGLPNRFIHEVRDTAGMRQHYGINAEQVVSDIARWLNNA